MATAEQNAKRELRRQRLLNDPIPNVVIAMAIPTILSSIVTSLYNMADTYFCSSLGTAATAAVGVNHSLDQVIQMAGSVIAIGANSYIARLLGAKEDKKANQVLAIAFFTALFIGLAVSILGFIFMNPLIDILGSTEEVKPLAISYARYILYASPFMITTFILNQCLRAEGSAAFSSIGMISGSILNCILDPIFIFALDLGVAGAAAATAISKFVSFSILLTPYIRKRTLLTINIKNLKYSWDILSEIGKIGLPTLFRSGLMTVANVVTNNIAGSFSTSALAAISVVNRIMQFVGSAIMGFGHGFQTVAGFNYGAKQYDRVKKSFFFALACGTSIVTFLAIIAVCFPEQIIGVFNKSGDTSMLAISKFSMTFRCIVMPLHAIVMVSQSSFTALGKAKEAAILSLSRQGFCLIPCVAILPRLFGVMGLAAAQGASDILAFCIAFPMTLSLMKKITKLHEESQLAAASEKK